jgi:hypothetical protein
MKTLHQSRQMTLSPLAGYQQFVAADTERSLLEMLDLEVQMKIP